MASYNDLHTIGWKRQVAAGNAVLAAGTRIHAIHLAAGADAATVTVYNAATAAGTDFIQLSAVLTGSAFVGLGPNGTKYATGVSIGATGTDVEFCVFYSED